MGGGPLDASCVAEDGRLSGLAPQGAGPRNGPGGIGAGPHRRGRETATSLCFVSKPKPDPGQSAGRKEPSAAGGHDNVLAGLEAAWERWASGIEVSDAKLRSLLRGAFAAGFEAGHDAATRR